MRLKCMVCARDLLDPEVPFLERINDYGQPGLFACKPHIAKAIHTVAAAKGVEGLAPHHQKPALRSLKVMQAT